MKRILCYGDSNTWGFIPGTGFRHPENVRWTGVVQKLLGDDFIIIEDGINGRTTVWDDPFHEEYINGFKGLGYSLNIAKPIDFFVLMLGGNDLSYTDASGVYKGLYKIIQRVLCADEAYKAFTKGSAKIWRSKPDILLITPPAKNKALIELDPARGKFRFDEYAKIDSYVQKLVQEFNLHYLNAAQVATASPIDGLHMDEEGHRKIGEAVATKLKEIFSQIK